MNNATHNMKAVGVVAAILLAIAAFNATASSFSCRTIGSYTYCDDGYGHTTTCYYIGDVLYCDTF